MAAAPCLVAVKSSRRAWHLAPDGRLLFQRREEGAKTDPDTRVERVHTEQMEFVGIYDQQINLWRAEKLSPSRISELDRMDTQNQQLREVTKAVLELADELRKGTIDGVLGMSDLDLGL